MAGTEARKKTPSLGQIVGEIAEYAFQALLTAALAMILMDDVLARYDVTNPGFGWYFTITLVIGVIVGFVTNVSRIYNNGRR